MVVTASTDDERLTKVTWEEGTPSQRNVLYTRFRSFYTFINGYIYNTSYNCRANTTNDPREEVIKYHVRSDE